MFLRLLQSRRPGRFIPAQFPAHIFFHPWSWLCLLATLLCGIAVVTADDTRSSALTVSVNSSVTGTISEPGDIDYWRINVPSAGQLVVETTGATDTLGVLEDNAGNELDEHDDLDYPSNRNFRIEWTVTAGTYYIRVRAYMRNTGDYTLHVRHTPAAGGDTGGGSTGTGTGSSDAHATFSPVLGDLNGDGRDDVLLRHTDGTWHYYPMNGRDYLPDQRGAAFLTSNLDWQFAGIGDLNGDGKDDVLVRRVTDGRWYYYPMDGRRHLIDQRGGTSIISDLAWQFAGIGDLNGDGNDDVLLRHRDDGRWLYYPMDGRTHITGGRGLANIPRDLSWQLAGIGDLNGDGRDDVLLRHTNGTWQYFPMNGRDYLSSERGAAFLTSNPDWQFAGIGDLNGDGKDDVLVRHVETGRWYYYPMDGRRHITADDGGANIVSDPAWQLAGIGDLNGDGKDDVLLRHRDDGRWLYYPMDGREYIAGQRGVANITRDPAWTITITATGGTGRPPILILQPNLYVDVDSDLFREVLTPREEFTLNIRVGNNGKARSPATLLRVYVSEDDFGLELTDSDLHMLVTVVDIPELSGSSDHIPGTPISGIIDLDIKVNAPSTPGKWYYGVCVDRVENEDDVFFNDNCDLYGAHYVYVEEDDGDDGEDNGVDSNDNSDDNGSEDNGDNGGGDNGNDDGRVSLDRLPEAKATECLETVNEPVTNSLGHIVAGEYSIAIYNRCNTRVYVRSLCVDDSPTLEQNQPFSGVYRFEEEGGYVGDAHGLVDNYFAQDCDNRGFRWVMVACKEDNRGIFEPYFTAPDASSFDCFGVLLE